MVALARDVRGQLRMQALQARVSDVIVMRETLSEYWPAGFDRAATAVDLVGARLLGAAAALLYLLTISRHPTGDAIVFAIKAETEGLVEGIESHQILTHVMAKAVYGLWRALGWEGRALQPLEVLNALAGGMAVGLMYVVARRLGCPHRTAVVVAAGFSVSCGTWLLSTGAQFAMPALIVALAVFYLLIGLSPEQARQPRFAVWVGLWLGLAAIAYLTHLLLWLVAAAAFLTTAEVGQRERVRGTGLCLLTAGVVFGCVYVAVLLTRGGADGFAALRGWSPHPGFAEYSGVDWLSIPQGINGFLKSLVGYPGIDLRGQRTLDLWRGMSNPDRLGFASYYLGVLGVALAPLWHVVRRPRGGVGVDRRRVWMLGFGAGLFGVFAIYWVPSAIQFWILVMAIWWLLAGLVVDAGRGMALVVVVLAGLNARVVLPSAFPGPDDPYQVAESLAAWMGPRDQVVLVDRGELQVYTYYATRGRSRSIVDVIGTRGAMSSRRLDEMIERVHAADGSVYLFGWDGGGDGAPADRDLALAGQLVADRYALRSVGVVRRAVVYEVMARSGRAARSRGRSRNIGVFSKWSNELQAVPFVRSRMVGCIIDGVVTT